MRVARCCSWSFLGICSCHGFSWRALHWGNWRDTRGNQRNCRAFDGFPVLAMNTDDSVIRGPTVQSSYDSTAPRAQTLAIATPACVPNTPPRRRLDCRSGKPPSAGEIPANTGVLISASLGPRPQRIGYSRKRVNSTLAHGLLFASQSVPQVLTTMPEFPSNLPNVGDTRKGSSPLI